jgi:hypothetical protein
MKQDSIASITKAASVREEGHHHQISCSLLILVSCKNQGSLLVHSETQPPTLEKEKKRTAEA